MAFAIAEEKPGEYVFENPSWTAAHSYLLQPSRAVRVASPCAGLDAPMRASRELGFPWESVLTYDIGMHVVGPLRKLHGSNASLHLGPVLGDMCAPSVEDILVETDYKVDGLCSGFPCPPFSSMGVGNGASDGRVLACYACISWIVGLAQHAGLSWFVLENVPGILKRVRGEQSFAMWLEAEISARLLQAGLRGWQVHIHRHNSRHCHLAQHRDRVFFCGTCPAMRAFP